jgi:hypothetical protein
VTQSVVLVVAETDLEVGAVAERLDRRVAAATERDPIARLERLAVRTDNRDAAGDPERAREGSSAVVTAIETGKSGSISGPSSSNAYV